MLKKKTSIQVIDFIRMHRNWPINILTYLAVSELTKIKIKYKSVRILKKKMKILGILFLPTTSVHGFSYILLAPTKGFHF